jgi:hypothetical protein
MTLKAISILPNPLYEVVDAGIGPVDKKVCCLERFARIDSYASWYLGIA